eukprot:3808303-Pyramimonas_sp.AAC.1
MSAGSVAPAAAVPTRHAVADVDATCLGQELKRYVVSAGTKTSFALHSYQYLTRGRAVHARSLHLMMPLVEVLLKNIPSAEIKWSQLRAACLYVIDRRPRQLSQGGGGGWGRRNGRFAFLYRERRKRREMSVGCLGATNTRRLTCEGCAKMGA